MELWGQKPTLNGWGEDLGWEDKDFKCRPFFEKLGSEEVCRTQGLAPDLGPSVFGHLDMGGKAYSSA